LEVPLFLAVPAFSVRVAEQRRATVVTFVVAVVVVVVTTVVVKVVSAKANCGELGKLIVR
jgi:hypothetical protein